MDVRDPGCKEKTFDELIAGASYLKNVSEFSADMYKILIPEDESVKLISKAILTNVPFGLYKNSYIFIKRPGAIAE